MRWPSMTVSPPAICHLVKLVPTRSSDRNLCAPLSYTWFRVSGLGLGFMVQGLWFMVLCFGCRVWGLRFMGREGSQIQIRFGVETRRRSRSSSSPSQLRDMGSASAPLPTIRPSFTPPSAADGSATCSRTTTLQNCSRTTTLQKGQLLYSAPVQGLLLYTTVQWFLVFEAHRLCITELEAQGPSQGLYRE